jgi:hypothetical protein
VALGSALWSAVSAVRSRKARAETDQLVKDAANAAIRSADAESQAAAVLARLTAVHEEQARIRSAERSAEREAAGTAPIWYLQRQDEFHVLLHNVSNGPRFHVTASGEQIRRPEGFAWSQIDRGTPQLIQVLAGDDARPEIVVTWYDTEVKAGEPRRYRGVPITRRA